MAVAKAANSSEHLGHWTRCPAKSSGSVRLWLQPGQAIWEGNVGHPSGEKISRRHLPDADWYRTLTEATCPTNPAAKIADDQEESMPSVVFLRGVNVGGHKTFQPSVLAKALTDFDVVNVGAAGTFVIRKPISQQALRAEFLRRLTFEPELMICRGRDLLDLADEDPFAGELADKEVKRYVSVLAKRPRKPPFLPLGKPAGEEWQVKIIAVTGRFALSLHRRLGRTLVYPNEVVEKNFGVAATTRNWDTIAAVCEILRGGK
jgi:uncharacterized protein (DUF1697 family)